MTPLRSELEEQLRGIGIAPGLPIDSPSVDQLISSLEALIEKREKALMHEIIDLHNEPGFGTDFDGIAEEVIKRAGYKPELRGDTNE